MGACDKADLSQKVMCCAGKVQVIVLGAIFFVSGLATAGLLYWQISSMEKNSTGLAKAEAKIWYTFMVIPGLMVLTSLCVFAILGLALKMLLVICIAWPAITSAGHGYLVYLSYTDVDNYAKASNMSKEDVLKMYADLGFYILYIIPAGSALFIILALYCIVLIVCLACCQRGGAGRDDDLYSLEENEEADGIESSTKSHISIE